MKNLFLILPITSNSHELRAGLCHYLPFLYSINTTGMREELTGHLPSVEMYVSKNALRKAKMSG